MLIEDITILSVVPCIKGTTGRLYYYKGNFFYPIMVTKKTRAKIITTIRNFSRKNSNRIQQDRQQPDYVSKVKLIEQAFYGSQ